MKIEQGNPGIERGYCIVFEAKPLTIQEQKGQGRASGREPRVLVLSFCDKRIGEKLSRGEVED